MKGRAGAHSTGYSGDIVSTCGYDEVDMHDSAGNRLGILVVQVRTGLLCSLRDNGSLGLHIASALFGVQRHQGKAWLRYLFVRHQAWLPTVGTTPDAA